MKITRRDALKSSALAATSLALQGPRLFSQAAGVDAHIDIVPSEAIGTISPEIYGHFIEHLGGVIYDGVWVGRDSKIANTGGIRQSFVDMMRSIHAPLLRWPGGCFADSYDWRDGIGSSRPARAAFWGQMDSNQYGLHEFMHTCRATGAKPYLAANMRTLPARDFYDEIEYCNAPSGEVPTHSHSRPVANSLAAQRAANGDPQPFNVDLWGVGNESWGCGGNLVPEEYAAMFRRFTAWTPSFDSGKMRFVAVGPNGDDLDWTRRLFKSLYSNAERRHLFGLSVHYYTSGSPKEFAAGDALNYGPDEYYDLLTRASIMERVVVDHYGAILEASAGVVQPSVKLVVDEWGAWYGSSTRIGPEYNLSQQSTMRDALLAGITLDIFQRHAEKMGAACVAQTINCLHSLMMAKDDQYFLTPTYHVFRMYMPHMGAQAVRAEFSASSIPNPMANAVIPVGGNSYTGSLTPEKYLKGLSGSASISAANPKLLTLTVVNPHLDRPVTAGINIGGAAIAGYTGTVLAMPDVHAHNDFAQPDAVKPSAAVTAAVAGGRVMHTFPPASVTALQITLA